MSAADLMHLDHIAVGIIEENLLPARDGLVAPVRVGNAGFVEMALAASTYLTDGPSHTVEQLVILSPLLLSEDETKIVQFRLDPSKFELRFGCWSLLEN